MHTIKILLWSLGVILTIFPVAVITRIVMDGEKLDGFVWKMSVATWILAGVIFFILAL